MQNSSSTISESYWHVSEELFSKSVFASKSKGHCNAFNKTVKGAHASATATAEAVAVSTVNEHLTGANASASASTSAVRVNALNSSVTGANASVSATADGLNVAAGNLNHTGVEVAASASASAAKVTVGNMDITGASAGASCKVNGVGVTAGNVAIGGPSAAVSASIDGSFSFGNVNLGLRPSLDIGFGLNIVIPFLSGSKMGSGGNSGNSGSRGGENPRGLEGLQNYLSGKFPNKRIYANPVDVRIRPHTTGEPIDPLLPTENLERSNEKNSDVDQVIESHKKHVEDGDKFVGFKGGPKRTDSSTEQSTALSHSTSGENNATCPTTDRSSTEQDIWSGMYASPSPDVAGGYAIDDKGNPGDISRVYLPSDSADVYYTKIGLETSEGKAAVKAVKEHSRDRYIFTGPQSSTQKDLFAPETVISPKVRDDALASGTITFEPSAHTINDKSCRKQLEVVYEQELACSQIVPDYLVSVKTAADCARDGGREQQGHVFQGRPPYGYENSAPDDSEPSDDDKMLLEECKKLGFEPTLAQLNKWKKKLKSDEEYEREEEASRRANQESNRDHPGPSPTIERQEKEVEEDNESPKPCKDHAINVRCFKCTNGSSGPRIRQINGQIHGFDFKK